MFENAGNKIKDFAKVWFGIQCAAAVIGGVVLISQYRGMGFIGLLIIIGGSFVAWIFSLLLYGFGEIVDTAIANRYMNKIAPMPRPVVSHSNSGTQRVPAQPMAKKPQVQPAAQEQAAVGGDSWICPRCKTKNLKSRTTCWSCGASVSDNAEEHN